MSTRSQTDGPSAARGRSRPPKLPRSRKPPVRVGHTDRAEPTDHTRPPTRRRRAEHQPWSRDGDGQSPQRRGSRAPSPPGVSARAERLLTARAPLPPRPDDPLRGSRVLRRARGGAGGRQARAGGAGARRPHPVRQRSSTVGAGTSAVQPPLPLDWRLPGQPEPPGGSGGEPPGDGAGEPAVLPREVAVAEARAAVRESRGRRQARHQAGEAAVAGTRLAPPAARHHGVATAPDGAGGSAPAPDGFHPTRHSVPEKAHAVAGRRPQARGGGHRNEGGAAPSGPAERGEPSGMGLATVPPHGVGREPSPRSSRLEPPAPAEGWEDASLGEGSATDTAPLPAVPADAPRSEDLPRRGSPTPVAPAAGTARAGATHRAGPAPPRPSRPTQAEVDSGRSADLGYLPSVDGPTGRGSEPLPADTRGAEDTPGEGRSAQPPTPPPPWGRLGHSVRERLPLWLQSRCGVRAGTVLAVAAVLALALALAGYHFWSGRPEPVEPPSVAEGSTSAREGGASPLPTSSAAPGTADAARNGPANPGGSGGKRVVVDIAGKVREPGVHRLPSGSRVADAIKAAGGLRRGADTKDLNRARVLVDGEQIVVGAPQRDNGPPQGGTAAPAAGRAEGAPGLPAARGRAGAPQPKPP